MADCSIKEMQLWISDNVTSTCWRPHNPGQPTDSRHNHYRCQTFSMAVLRRVLSLHQPSQSRKPSPRLRFTAASASCRHTGMTNSLKPSYQCSKLTVCCDQAIRSKTYRSSCNDPGYFGQEIEKRDVQKYRRSLWRKA